MDSQPLELLDGYRREAGLSHEELWIRYFELGGMGTALQVEAYLYGALNPSGHDHDVLAHALNERFVELGGNHPVPYCGIEPDLPTDGGSSTTDGDPGAEP